MELQGKMKVSIVIVNWNVRDFLRKCLTAIYKSITDLDFEIFVVDNNSSDGSGEMVRKEFLAVRLIENRNNMGFARANNMAIKEAGGDYILLLNPDTEVMEKSVNKMVSFMDAHREIGILAPKLLYPDGTRQESIVPPFSFSSYFLNEYFPFSKRAFMMHKIYSTQAVENPTGACLMVRKNVFEKIGLFDESFFVSWEDVDFCRRAGKGGIKILFFPEAEIVHHKSQCSKNNPHHAAYKYRGLRVFVKKYYGMAGICVIALDSLVQLFITYVIFPLSRFIIGKPKDIGYFKNDAKIMWHEIMRIGY